MKAVKENYHCTTVRRLFCVANEPAYNYTCIFDGQLVRGFVLPLGMYEHCALGLTDLFDFFFSQPSPRLGLSPYAQHQFQYVRYGRLVS